MQLVSVAEPGFELRGPHARLHCDIQTPFSQGKLAQSKQPNLTGTRELD